MKSVAIPAKAGIQESPDWTPAFAGVTSYLVYLLNLVIFGRIPLKTVESLIHQETFSCRTRYF